MAAEPAGDLPRLTLGPFDFQPRLFITQAYDDNVYATPAFEEADGYVVISPSVSATARGEDYRLSFRGGVDMGRYYRLESENYNDVWFRSNGQYSLGAGSYLFGGFDYSFEHEGRSSPDATFGREPTTYHDLLGHVGLSQSLGEAVLRLGGTVERLDFNDTPLIIGEINEDDRDRTEYEIGARLTYDFGEGFSPFVQATGDFRRYDSTPDDFGFARDSDGFRTAIGLRYESSRSLSVEGFVGVQHQDYEDPDLEDPWVAALGARVTWEPDARSSLVGFVDRTLEETTEPGASAYLYTEYGLDFLYRAAPDLSFSLYASLSEADYVGIERTDWTASVGAGAKYFLTPNIFLGLDFTHVERHSDLAEADYTENVVLARIGAQWNRGYDPASVPPAGDGPDLGGFYVGAGIGVGSLMTNLEGPRGSPMDDGSLDADFGGFGPAGSLFAGWGIAFDRLNLAVEISGEAGGARWDHARLPGGRVFSVDKDWGLGFDVRAGWGFNGGSQAYLRGGLGLAALEGSYTTETGPRPGHSEVAVGWRVGGGTEVALDEQFFLRLDHGYADFGDFEIGPGRGPDRFDVTEATSMVGFGYRFGAGEEPVATVQHDFGGFYAGLAVGHEALFNDVSGSRSAGSTLTADFGNDGILGGLFVGYGEVFEGFYVGGELGLEAGTAYWEHVRVDEGRIFRVDQDFAWTAELRAGYVLADRALLYLTGGLAQARVNTQYERGMQFEDPTDLLTGFRVGVGMDLALDEQLFLRSEISFSRFGASEVDYNTGVDSFDAGTKTQFQVGLGLRF